MGRVDFEGRKGGEFNKSETRQLRRQSKSASKITRKPPFPRNQEKLLPARPTPGDSDGILPTARHSRHAPPLPSPSS